MLQREYYTNKSETRDFKLILFKRMDDDHRDSIGILINFESRSIYFH
jgi:hypothetical protein